MARFANIKKYGIVCKKSNLLQFNSLCIIINNISQTKMLFDNNNKSIIHNLIEYNLNSKIIKDKGLLD